METNCILQNQNLMRALREAFDDIANGRVIVQQENESIEQLLNRITKD